jgi:hypothetical protein
MEWIGKKLVNTSDVWEKPALNLSESTRILGVVQIGSGGSQPGNSLLLRVTKQKTAINVTTGARRMNRGIQPVTLLANGCRS